MTTIKYASVGSICSGTMRVAGLLIRFANELEWLMKDQPKSALQGSRYRLKKLIKDARAIAAEPDTQEADDILAGLFDALEQFAPPYCYFGAIEGDGADYGFWPCHDTIQELYQVEDSNEAKELGSDCMSINDHGNVTVYDARGRVILDLV